MISKSAFYEKLLEKFPEVALRRTVTSKEALAVALDLGLKSVPERYTHNRISWGVYPLDNFAVLTEGVKKLKQPKKVDQATFVVLNAANPQLSVAPVSYISESAAIVPIKNPNFIPFGIWESLSKIIRSNAFFPTYITGPSGNGKSTTVEQVCAAHQRPLIRINLNALTDEDQLIGSKTLVDGNVEVVDGPVLTAMRNGYVLLLDEIDAASVGALFSIQGILEGKPYYFKLNNEVIVPAPGFTIIATGNTKGKGSDDGQYIGTNVLNEAFLDRFNVTLEQDYPTASVEIKIVNKLLDSLGKSNPEYAQRLVTWAQAIRKTFNEGGVDQLVTTRRLSHIAKAYAIFDSEFEAVKLACNRFSAEVEQSFVDLYKKLDPVDHNPVPLVDNGNLDEVNPLE